MQPLSPHARRAQAWLTKNNVHSPNDQRMATLLLLGLRTIWERSRPSLGAALLAATVERVIRVAEHRHVALTRVGLRVLDRSSIEMRDPAAFTPEAGNAVAFTLAELLDVLDRITGHTLTPVLHRALLAATIDRAPRW